DVPTPMNGVRSGPRHATPPDGIVSPYAPSGDAELDTLDAADFEATQPIPVAGMAPIAAKAPGPKPPAETHVVPRGEQGQLEDATPYVLPNLDVLAKGAPHKTRSSANDR